MTDADLARWQRVSGPVRRRMVVLHAGAALAVYSAGATVSIVLDPSRVDRGWGWWLTEVVMVAMIGAGMGLATMTSKRAERINAWHLMRAMELEGDDPGALLPSRPIATTPPPS
jgi:hypothetical protein